MLTKLRDDDLQEVKNFLQEVREVCPTIAVQKYEPPQIPIILEPDQNFGADNLAQKIRHPNPFKNYQIDNNDLTPLKSTKVRGVQAAVVKYVFANLFFIDLTEEEAEILSYHRKVSIPCVFF